MERDWFRFLIPKTQLTLADLNTVERTEIGKGPFLSTDVWLACPLNTAFSSVVVTNPLFQFPMSMDWRKWMKDAHIATPHLRLQARTEWGDLKTRERTAGLLYRWKTSALLLSHH